MLLWVGVCLIPGAVSADPRLAKVDLGYTPGVLVVHPRTAENVLMAKDPSCKSVSELLGVMEVPTVGRERLVATAVEVCYRNGFNAVGIDQILAKAGVTKSTFYKHFESKDDLLLAAIRLRDEWETEAWMRAVRKLVGDDPRLQLTAVFDVLDRWFNDPAFGGCFFINAAAEYPNPHDPIHQAAATHKQKFWAWVEDRARTAGCRDSEAFADAYTIVFEGALVMRQVYGRNDAASAARRNIERLSDSFFSDRD